MRSKIKKYLFLVVLLLVAFLVDAVSRNISGGDKRGAASQLLISDASADADTGACVGGGIVPSSDGSCSEGCSSVGCFN